MMKAVVVAVLMGAAIAPIRAHAEPSDWRVCMARCQSAIDRMNPAHVLWRQAMGRAMEAAKERIAAEWKMRDCILGLKCDLAPPPHFSLDGDEGKSLEQFEKCLMVCGKP